MVAVAARRPRLREFRPSSRSRPARASACNRRRSTLGCAKPKARRCAERRAARESTCRARRPTSTAAAGKATRSPPIVTTSRSLFICPSPRSGLQRHQQTCAIVTVDAVVSLACSLRFGAQPDRLFALALGKFLADRCDDHVGFRSSASSMTRYPAASTSGRSMFCIQGSQPGMRQLSCSMA